MGLRPTQGDEKWVLFGNYTQWKRRPPLLSSRPELRRSGVERSAVCYLFDYCYGPREMTKGGAAPPEREVAEQKPDPRKGVVLSLW
jgi:hypothetical protein